MTDPPVLPISTGEGALLTSAPAVVFGIMLWPRDDQRRDQHLAYEYLKQSPGALKDQPGLAEAALSAPPLPELQREMETQGARGFAAGTQLCAALGMYGSLGSARRGCEGDPERPGLAGQQVPRAASERTLRDCWSEFRPVAHLWGAVRLLRLRYDQADAQELDRALEAILRPGPEFVEFLALAEALRAAGVEHLPPRASRHFRGGHRVNAEDAKPQARAATTLDPEESWALPPDLCGVLRRAEVGSAPPA